MMDKEGCAVVLSFPVNLSGKKETEHFWGVTAAELRWDPETVRARILWGAQSLGHPDSSGVLCDGDVARASQ